MKRRLNYMWQGVTLMAGPSWSPSARAQRPTNSTSTLHAKCNRVSSQHCTHHCWRTGEEYKSVWHAPEFWCARCIMCTPAMVLVSGGGAVAPQSTRTGRRGLQSPAPAPEPANQNYLNSALRLLFPTFGPVINSGFLLDCVIQLYARKGRQWIAADFFHRAGN